MTSLTIYIPDEVAQDLVADAFQRQVSPEQLVADELIRLYPKHSSDQIPDYTAYFGIAKGRPGALGSVEAIDRHIQELRDEW